MKPPPPVDSVDDRDRLSLIHELSVYQEQLLAQNEALVRTQRALEETRDRFIELYDFAPTGYLILDNNGVVLQCNLTAASLLGRSKHAVEGFPLMGFVVRHERARYAEFLRQCRSGRETSDVSSELTMSTLDGPRTISILCRPRRHDGRPREYFTSLTDVTAHRALEQERSRNARELTALASRLIAIQDDERLRIARNLHDDIGQQHTAIRLRLERLAQSVNDDAATLVSELQEMLARLDQRVHFVATELRPSALDLGLVSALDQFVRGWSDTFHVAADVVSNLPANTRLTPDVETHLYRIAQEALNNVAKHAGARNVSLVLDFRDEQAMLIVEDDGRGFDVEQAGDGNSPLGLIGMRERAQIVGGNLEIESVPGHGTSVFVTVPFKG